MTKPTGRQPADTKKYPEFEIFHPREKGAWPKLGVAFRNSDGSLGIVLDYIPVGSDGQIRLVAQTYKVIDEQDEGENAVATSSASENKPKQSMDATMPSARPRL